MKVNTLRIEGNNLTCHGFFLGEDDYIHSCNEGKYTKFHNQLYTYLYPRSFVVRIVL